MSNIKTNSYNVAFRGTSKENGHAGIITWTTFESKAKFDDFWKDADQTIQEIVEEGVSDERCDELVRTTPTQSYINAAVMDSRDPVTGDFDLSILEGKLLQFHFLDHIRKSQAA